jgi:hypothetical protein
MSESKEVPGQDLVEFLFQELEKNRLKTRLLKNHVSNLEQELKCKDHVIKSLQKSNYLWYISSMSFMVHIGIIYLFQNI